MARVDMRADGSERVQYDFDRYYAYIRPGQLSLWPGFAADSHWHEDLEFIYIRSGAMCYNVNGEIIRLLPGQGILVNARQLHYGFSETGQECLFVCILLHPMLLCATEQVEGQFVAPLIGDGAAPYLLLDPEIHWQRQILEDLQVIWDSREKEAAPLYIQSAFFHIWGLLADHAPAAQQLRHQDRQLTVLKQMLSFIQKNYPEKITLVQIARAGNVSKSTCLTVFRKYLRNTPTNYLIDYRLKQAAALLEDRDLPVSEIALEVGFQSGSYFAESFRRCYGCTPRQYRAGKRQKNLQNV